MTRVGTLMVVPHGTPHMTRVGTLMVVPHSTPHMTRVGTLIVVPHGTPYTLHDPCGYSDSGATWYTPHPT